MRLKLKLALLDILQNFLEVNDLNFDNQHIPIEDTLCKLLQKPDIVNEIENFHGSGDSTLQDMCDGSVFKFHPHFSTDKQTIQVIAYFDEVELCNPLGSNTKLGCIFFTIGNIRQCFRSRLKCILL